MATTRRTGRKADTSGTSVRKTPRRAAKAAARKAAPARFDLESVPKATRLSPLKLRQYGGTFQKVKIQESASSSDVNFLAVSNAGTTTGCQLTNDRYILYAKNSGRNVVYVYNGLTVSIVSMAGATPIPFSWNPQNITPVFGSHDDFYIAKNGSDYYQCDPAGFTATSVISFPTGYTPVKMFSTSDTLNTLYYWQLQTWIMIHFRWNHSLTN